MADPISTPAAGTSQPAHLALSRTIKALTSFLFDGIALPDYLTKYGPLLLTFTSGAAAATALYAYLQRNRLSRAKVKLAVFHITRIVEHTPRLQKLLDDPHKLIKLMDQEVMHMVKNQLTKSEAAETMAQVKRELWDDPVNEIEPPRKRTKSCPPALGVHVAAAQAKQHEQGLGIVDEQSPGVVDEQSPGDVSMLDVTQPSSSSQSTPCPQAGLSQHAPSSLSPNPPRKALRERASSSSPNLRKLPPRTAILTSSPPQPTAQLPELSSSPVGLPSSSPTAQGVELPKSKSTKSKSPEPSGGFGLDYNDDNLYSTSPPNASGKVSSPDDKQLPTKKPSFLDEAIRRAFDPNAPGNRPYQSPVFSQPRAKKPASTVALHRPPNNMAVKTGKAKKGTWLGPIQEGVSPQVDLAASTSRYRVAESRQYYKNIETGRIERQNVREFFKIGERIERTREAEESHTPKKSLSPDPQSSSSLRSLTPSYEQLQSPSPTITRVASAIEKLPSTPPRISDRPNKVTKRQKSDSPMPPSRGAGQRKKMDKELGLYGTPVSIRKSSRRTAYKGSYA
jgi:hypothetical protein